MPFEDFETQNGKIMIAAGNDVLWANLCKAIGKAELLEDKKFRTNTLRNENYELLKPILAEIMKKETTEHWQEVLDNGGIPNGPINTIDKVIEHPQIKARNMIVEIDHPVSGNLKIPGIPIKLSDTPGNIRRPSPSLGQHTNQILKEILAYDEEKIRELEKENIF